MNESLRRLAMCAEAQRGGGRYFDIHVRHLAVDAEAEFSSAEPLEMAYIDWKRGRGDAGRGRYARLDATLGGMEGDLGSGEAWSFTRLAFREAQQALRAAAAAVDLHCALLALEGHGGRLFGGPGPGWPSDEDVAASPCDDEAWGRVGGAVERFAERTASRGPVSLADTAAFASDVARARLCVARLGACRAAVILDAGGLLDALASGAQHEALRACIERGAGLLPADVERVGRGFAVAAAAREGARGGIRRAFGDLRLLHRRGGGHLLPLTEAMLEGVLDFEPWAWAAGTAAPPAEVRALARSADELVRAFGERCEVDVEPAPAPPAPAPALPWPEGRLRAAFEGLRLAAADRGWTIVARPRPRAERG